MDMEKIKNEAVSAMEILLEAAKPHAGEILVVGCSTSEVMGQRIGSASNEDVAKALMDGILPIVKQRGLYLAVQGCEHINRSVVVERTCMERYGLTQVWVEPWLHAGGAFATEAAKRFDDHVMVENLNMQATLGMDIGDTLIGMHLRPVVVPIHSAQRRIGEANLVLARVRPKYVGGPRAHYDAACDSH